MGQVPQQGTEHLALTQACYFSEGKAITLYIDSLNAFSLACAHGTLYIKRRLSNSAGKKIENKEKNHDSTRGHFAGKEGMHYPLQRTSQWKSPEAQENKAADLAT